MDPEWRLWRHKQDHSVLYEVREWSDWYECARPGQKDYESWQMPKDAFEEVYEPVPRVVIPEERSG